MGKAGRWSKCCSASAIIPARPVIALRTTSGRPLQGWHVSRRGVTRGIQLHRPGKGEPLCEDARCRHRDPSSRGHNVVLEAIHTPRQGGDQLKNLIGGDGFGHVA